MPAYNAARFIEESIESVLNQTYTNWELIIVDDGSSDNTQRLVRQFIERDDRIRYIYQENGRQGKARNNGIWQSKGKLIAFLDADDKWMATKLEKQVQHINDTDADIVFADAVIIDENGQQLKSTWGVHAEKYIGDNGILAFLHSNRMPILTVLARRESIIAANGFKESPTLQYGEDYDLWFRMLQQDRIFIGSSEKLAAYRRHKGQSTANKHTMLEIIPTIKTVHIADKSLLKKKNQLLKLGIRKFIKTCSPHITRHELQQVISLFPFPIERHFFLLLNRSMNLDMLAELILLYCRKAVNSKTYK